LLSNCPIQLIRFRFGQRPVFVCSQAIPPPQEVAQRNHDRLPRLFRAV